MDIVVLHRLGLVLYNNMVDNRRKEEYSCSNNYYVEDAVLADPLQPRLLDVHHPVLRDQGVACAVGVAVGLVLLLPLLDPQHCFLARVLCPLVENSGADRLLWGHGHVFCLNASNLVTVIREAGLSNRLAQGISTIL